MRKICESISVRADKSTGTTRVRFNTAKVGETYVDVLDLALPPTKSPSDAIPIFVLDSHLELSRASQ